MSLRRTRLAYVFFFRLIFISLLLGARLLEEASAPAGVPPWGFTPGLLLVIVSYASAIGLSLWLRRAQNVERVAVAQVVFDLCAATMLVHLTGGVESQMSFTYLIIVAGAGLMFPKGAVRAALGAIGLFCALVVARRWGLVAPLGGSNATPLRELIRATMLNSVAIAATGALGARLAVELARTDARLDQKNAQFEDLATLYSDVVRSLSSGLMTVGLDGRVATVNQAALTILGLDENEVMGRTLASGIPEMATLLDAPRVVRREEVAFFDRSHKPRRLGVTVSPLVDSANRQVGQIVTFQDLTELRQMEEAVTRQKRLAAIGRLAAGIAHEIRNPLAAISGSIELLVSSGIGDSSADSRELAQIVQRETQRLNGLITELLEFARPRALELVPLDLSEAVNELVQVFENDPRLRDSSVKLVAPQPVLVHADASQLRQVVWNLMRNAAEAAPNSEIEIRVEQDGVLAKLTIRDTGAGIPEENLSRVFEPFFSTKESGTGLGLPTVHRIIEEHKGTVELVRNADGGTSAVVSLPRVE